MLKYGLLLYSMLLAFVLYAQSGYKHIVEGAWCGELTQKSGGFAENYSFEIYINVRESETGQLIDGRTYIGAKNAFGEMSFTGQLINNTLFLKEKELLYSDKPSMLSWCYKKIQLKLVKKPDEWFLEGSWEGSSKYGYCLPGRVVLKKIVPQA